MTDGRTSGPPPTAPPEPVIRDALARIVASDVFRSAPQLVAFLTFVVEKTIAGESGELKGYTIATRALGRSPEFDPQVDPIVRVEAMRLRRALQTYYAGPGLEDPLIVAIPRGSYVPQFTERGVSGQIPAPLTGSPTDWTPEARPAPQPPRFRIAPMHLKLAGAIVLGLVVGIAGTLVSKRELAGVIVSQREPLFPRVTVAVDTESGALVEEGTLHDALIQTLTPFDEIVVVEDGSAPAASRGYRLAVRAAAAARGGQVSARLVHGPTGEVVWSTSFPAPAIPANGARPETVLARHLAVKLATPYGVIASDQRGRNHSDRASACIARVFRYWFGPTVESHAAARDCLEADFAEGARDPVAMAYLAFLYLDEARSGFNPRPGSLDRAFAMAQRAVERAPESARTHQVLMNVQFGRRDVEAAIATGRRAAMLNPLDPELLANFGSRLIEVGRYREGLAVLADAEALTPHLPPKQTMIAALAHVMLGEDDAAAAAARQTPPDHPLALIARIIVASRAGEAEEAARLAERLRVLHADIHANPGSLLVRRFNGEMVARIVEELSQAGVGSVVSGAVPRTVPPAVKGN